MAEKTPPSASSRSNLNIQPPRPASNAASNSNLPFTPRSSTFSDGLDSDSEFDTFEPTPVHSPGGPQYDDLPPSYDEAQQQALQEARAGILPLDPNNLEVHRMVLSDDQSSPPPPHPDVRPQRSVPSLASDPNAYEFEPENRRNASGLGMTVPVQQVRRSEQIPVGQIPARNNIPTGRIPPLESDTTAPDPTSMLLSRALEFTRHEPDADARYAPRLVRSVAIPQEGVPPSDRVEHRGPGRHRGRDRRERGRGDHGPPWHRGAREMRRMPGQWPEFASSETLNTETASSEEPAQFLRAYAKALHAHSIRPAEFTEFLDGLNALCIATNTTPSDLLYADRGVDAPSAIVQDYINSTNEVFFAPRGLKVSLQSLSTLLDALKVPEERGQRAGAAASALDEKYSTEQRAQAIHPWIEKLETSVPSPSTQTLLLREMSERFRRQCQSTWKVGNHATAPQDSEKAGMETRDSDPPHSVPEPPPGPGSYGFPGFPPFGGHPGWRPGPWGPWQGNQGPWGRGGHHGRGWGAPWCPPPHHGFPRGRGGPGFGFASPRGFGPGNGNPDTAYGNNWAAWGENIGKWGEEFGKRMGEWGEQFGRRAEIWGEGVGASFEGARGRGAENATREPDTQNRGQNGTQAAPASVPEALTGQENGVLREDNMSNIVNPERNKKGKDKKIKKDDANDDDDASSTSSDSSDSDSDSEDEEEYPNSQEIFLARIREINDAATLSQAKGKKSAQEIFNERALAIEKAQSDKKALDLKIQKKREKRALKRHLRQRKREIKREHRRVKRELRGLAKREGREERREVKRRQREEYREKRWKGKRHEGRKGRWENGGGVDGSHGEDRMVWLVIENLGG